MKRCYKNQSASEKYLSFTEDPSLIPFSFVYGGEKYCGFDARFFEIENREVKNDFEKQTQNITFSFQKTLRVTLVISHYFSHGVTEWTVWFENFSEYDSKILEKFETELCFEGNIQRLREFLATTSISTARTP